MSKAQSVNVSIGLTFPLFLIFLVLKLTETVTWSWWLVTIPLWAGPAIVLAILGVGAVLFGLYLGGALLVDLCKGK